MTSERHTGPGDLLLIQADGNPAGFARVEAIRPHELEGWFHCDLLLLAVPPRPITWILEQEQLDGKDFTMSGQPMRLERLPEIGAVHAAAADVEAGEASAGDEAPLPGAAARVRPAGAKGNIRLVPREGPAKVVELFPGRSEDRE
ncbi:MAG: hypothetical protein VCC00_06520 [Deltaproteobacteria bacterium]